MSQPSTPSSSASSTASPQLNSFNSPSWSSQSSNHSASQHSPLMTLFRFLHVPSSTSGSQSSSNASSPSSRASVGSSASALSTPGTPIRTVSDPTSLLLNSPSADLQKTRLQRARSLESGVIPSEVAPFRLPDSVASSLRGNTAGNGGGGTANIGSPLPPHHRSLTAGNFYGSPTLEPQKPVVKKSSFLELLAKSDGFMGSD